MLYDYYINLLMSVEDKVSNFVLVYSYWKNVILIKSLHLAYIAYIVKRQVSSTDIYFNWFVLGISQNCIKKVSKHKGINFAFLNVVVLNITRLFKWYVSDFKSRKRMKRYFYLLCYAIHLILTKSIDFDNIDFFK